MNILLIEDNPADAQLVRKYFESKIVDEKAEIIHVTSIREAELALAQSSFPAVLLDLSLPDSEALEGLVRILPVVKGAPVIVMTGHTDEKLGIEAVRCGAQDYLMKGDTTPEHLIRSIFFAIERTANRENQVKLEVLQMQPVETKFDAGLFRIDLEKQNIWLNENAHLQLISLTPIEFKLFVFFLRNSGQVLSRGQILADLWEGKNSGISSRTLDKHISSLKHKSPQIEACVESVYGVGYKFNLDAA